MVHFEACGKPSGRIAIQSLGILEQWLWLLQQRIHSTAFKNQLLKETLDHGTPNDHTAQISRYDLGLLEPLLAKLDRPHSCKAVTLKISGSHLQAHSCEKWDSFNRKLAGMLPIGLAGTLLRAVLQSPAGGISFHSGGLLPPSPFHLPLQAFPPMNLLST